MLNLNQNLPQKSTLSLTGRGRVGKCPGIVFAATGSYTPNHIVTNDDLKQFGCDSDWIVQRTGIRERRKADPNQASSDLAYEAAIRCLENGHVSPSEVDLVIVATITPDHITPSTACLLQKRLGCIAPSMDINAACSGFMYALITGSQFVKSGISKNALVIGSEVMTRTVNPDDVKTFPLFGDGAGAVLLQPYDHGANCDAGMPGVGNDIHDLDAPGILSFTLGAEGCIDSLSIPSGGSREPLTAEGIALGKQFMHMDGRTVFKWAVRIVVDSCQDVLSGAGYSIEDVDWVVLHQANVRIIDAAMNQFNIPKDRVIVNLDRFGNTSAASVPLVLDELNHNGRLQRGDLILMCGFGAGLTWGAALVRW